MRKDLTVIVVYIICFRSSSFPEFIIHMQLVDHGISPLVMGKFKDEIEGFFKLPLEEKMKYKLRPGDIEGYGPVIISKDQKLDWGDRLYMITNPLNKRKPYLLPELPLSLRY